MAEQAVSLVLEGVGHSYRRRGKERGTATALVGVDLTLGVGAVGLLGPNGAGKSTLLRILATTLRPREGTVTLNGVEATANLRAYRRRLGYLPQRFGFLPQLTVAEFIEYAAWLKLVPASSRLQAVADALEATDLTSVAGRRMRELTGGMLRRAGIAQAVVNDPDVLLLDEPTVGLDPEQRTHLRAILRVLATRSCLLLATHLTEDVAAVCDRVLVLEAGRVCFDDHCHALEEYGAGDAASSEPPGSALERGYARVVTGARQGVAR